MRRLIWVFLLCASSFAQQALPAIGSNWKGSAGGGGGISVIQKTGCFNTTAALSEPCPFGTNLTAGHRILVACSGWEGVHGFATPTDTLGSTFVSLLDVNSNAGGATAGEEIHLYITSSTVTAGADTVTCAFSSGSDFITVSIWEVNGVSTLDQTGTLVPATATNTCSVTTAGATATANELVWVVCAKDQKGAWSLGTGYSNLVSESNTAANHGQGSEDNIITATGSQTGTMTAAGTAGNMTGAIVTLR